MYDPADLSQADIENRLSAALSVRKPEGPKPTGNCLSCQAPLPPGLRWCDSACRDDWEIDTQHTRR